MARFGDPEPLADRHVLDGFDCGTRSLNVWLVEHARAAASAHSARTYVIRDADRGRVVGYHALTAASVERHRATPTVTEGMPRYPIPVVLLARLAVDSSVSGRGLGAALLRDAMGRALAASEAVGVRALLVHAIDERARAFYAHHGLDQSPTDPLHLMITITDIAASINATSQAP
ncbi:MAG: GNAT family N-acetyltransferase [Solirubrobacteraceae bacterium]